MVTFGYIRSFPDVLSHILQLSVTFVRFVA